MFLRSIMVVVISYAVIIIYIYIYTHIFDKKQGLSKVDLLKTNTFLTFEVTTQLKISGVGRSGIRE